VSRRPSFFVVLSFVYLVVLFGVTLYFVFMSVVR
jgi:hypothetical protein